MAVDLPLLEKSQPSSQIWSRPEPMHLFVCAYGCDVCTVRHARYNVNACVAPRAPTPFCSRDDCFLNRVTIELVCISVEVPVVHGWLFLPFIIAMPTLQGRGVWEIAASSLSVVTSLFFAILFVFKSSSIDFAYWWQWNMVMSYQIFGLLFFVKRYQNCKHGLSWKCLGRFSKSSKTQIKAMFESSFVIRCAFN